MARSQQREARNKAKFLTFMLGRNTYGVEILKVQEIMRLVDITPVPQTPSYIRGVINLRGDVVAIADLRLKLGMQPEPDQDRSCIVVLQVPAPSGGTLARGIIVDNVAEVLDVRDEQLEPPPGFGEGIDVSFIKAIAKVDQKVVMILDVDRVLAPREHEGALADIEQSAARDNQAQTLTTP
jgi:purine-binding chemotaxis protein CheW